MSISEMPARSYKAAAGQASRSSAKSSRERAWKLQKFDPPLSRSLKRKRTEENRGDGRGWILCFLYSLLWICKASTSFQTILRIAFILRNGQDYWFYVGITPIKDKDVTTMKEYPANQVNAD